MASGSLPLLAPDFWAWRSGVFDLRQATRNRSEPLIIFSPCSTSTPDFREPRRFGKKSPLLPGSTPRVSATNRLLIIASLGDLHHKLAATLSSLGAYQEALVHARQALQLCATGTWAGPPGRRQPPLNSLCIDSQRTRRRSTPPSPHCERALAIVEKYVWIRCTLTSAAAFNNLGLVLRDLGDQIPRRHA